MRIIAGELRGRRLVAPAGRGTRPMLDRVREALFSTLAGRCEGARVLDLFAGSGSLGLEALSRGAEHVRFVERDRRARARLAENVAELGVAARSVVAAGDALDPETWDADGADGPYDLAFLDPPYPLLRERRGRGRILEALRGLVAGALRNEGTIVLHAHPRALREEDLVLDRPTECRVYGNTALWYVWEAP